MRPKGIGMQNSTITRSWVASGLICFCLAFAGLIGFSLPAYTASDPVTESHQGRSLDDAKQFITKLAHQSISVLQDTGQSELERQHQFEKVWSDGVAFETIGRFVLGRHWRSASPEQRIRYQELFVASVMRTSVSVLGSFGDEKLQITDARLAGKKDMLISTQFVRTDGPTIPVDWRVRVIDGRNQIIDVSIEGVSMALTKRSEYSSVVKNQGFEGLLEALQSSI